MANSPWQLLKRFLTLSPTANVLKIFLLFSVFFSFDSAFSQTPTTRQLQVQIDFVDQWLTASTAGLNAYEINRNSDLGSQIIGNAAELLGGEFSTLESLRHDINTAQSVVRRARTALRANHFSEAQSLLEDADHRSRNIRTRTSAFLEGVETGADRGSLAFGAAPVAACLVYAGPPAVAAGVFHAGVAAALNVLSDNPPTPPVTIASSRPLAQQQPAAAAPATETANGPATAATNPSEPVPASNRARLPIDRNTDQMRRLLAAYRRLVASQEASLRQMRAHSVQEPARLRSQTELVEAARQAALRWRQDGVPGIDWTQFLIENYAQQTQVARQALRPPRPLNNDEYSGWINRWQTVASNLTNRLTEAQRHNWDQAYDAVITQLHHDRRRTPQRANINIIDCIEGRFTNPQCEASLLWGALHRMNLRPPAAGPFRPALELRAETPTAAQPTAEQLRHLPPILDSVSWNATSFLLRRPPSLTAENGNTRGDLYQPALLALSLINQRRGELPYEANEILIARRGAAAPILAQTQIPDTSSAPQTPAPQATPSSSSAAPTAASLTTAEFLSNLRMVMQLTDPSRILAALRQIASIPEADLNRIMADALANHGPALSSILALAQRMNPDVIRDTVALARSQVTPHEIEFLTALGGHLASSVQSAPGASLFLLRNAAAIMALRERFAPLFAEMFPESAPPSTTTAVNTSNRQASPTTAAQDAASLERARRAIAEINAADGGRDNNHTVTRLIQTAGAVGPRAVSLALRNLSRLDPAALLQGMSMMGRTNPDMLRDIINQAQNLTPGQIAQIAEVAANHQQETQMRVANEESAETDTAARAAESLQQRCNAALYMMSEQEGIEFVVGAVMSEYSYGRDTRLFAPLPRWLQTSGTRSQNISTTAVRYLLPSRVQVLLEELGGYERCLGAINIFTGGIKSTFLAHIDGSQERRNRAAEYAQRFIMDSIDQYFEARISEISTANGNQGLSSLSSYLVNCTDIVRLWPETLTLTPPALDPSTHLSPWCTQHPRLPRLRQEMRNQQGRYLAQLGRQDARFSTAAAGSRAMMDSTFYSTENLLPLIRTLQSESTVEQEEHGAALAAENILRELWADQSGLDLQRTLQFTSRPYRGGYDRLSRADIEYFHHPEIFCREFYFRISTSLQLNVQWDRTRFIETCTHTPESQRILTRINHFRTAIRENPGLAFSDRTPTRGMLPSQVTQMINSLDNVPYRVYSLDFTNDRESPSPSQEQMNLYSQFVTYLGDSRRLGALPPPPRLMAPPHSHQQNTTSTPPPPSQRIQLPSAVTDDSARLSTASPPSTPGRAEDPNNPIELLLVPAPPNTQPQTQPQPTTAERHREALALSRYRPQRGQLRIPMATLLRTIFQNSNPTNPDSPLRRRWTPEFVREIIQIATREIPVPRSDDRYHNYTDWDGVMIDLGGWIHALARLSPGPIPGPYGTTISRDFAQLLHLFLSRSANFLFGAFLTGTTQINGVTLNNQVNNSFPNYEALSNFLQQLNREFGPPLIRIPSPPTPHPAPTAAAIRH